MLSESEFRLFKELIYEECGFHFRDEKRVFLESRLRKRMESLGIKTAYEYYYLIKHSHQRSQELPMLLDALMIGETSFFRNPPQFDLFRGDILPEIIRRKQKVGS